MNRTLTLVASLVCLSLPLAARQEPPAAKDAEAVTTASGLKYTVLKAGDGAKAKVGDVVRMHYTGWLTDGKKFDSSHDRGEPLFVEVGRGKVIKGWDEAIQLMSKGQKMKLTLPPEIAYGDKGFAGAIPPKATLVFEVELVDFAWSFQPLAAEGRKTTASGLAYQVLRPGSGATPQSAEFVSVRYAAWKPSGDLVRWSENEQQMRRTPPSIPVNVRVSSAESPFFQEALALTPLGGATRLEASASQCFPARLPPGVTSDTLITWQFEVLDLFSAPTFSMPAPAALQKTASGLQYEVIREGSGRQPKASSRATVHYAGWLPNGKQFDASFDGGQPATFGVGQVIKGWTEGLQLMKEGAIYKFVIPPELGYGAAGAPPDIPANATLVFYVVLIGTAG